MSQEADTLVPHTLRPAVAAFALAMEAQLRKHDATRGVAGWIGDSDDALIARLMEEQHELRRALEGGCNCRSAGECGHLPDWTAIRNEAADVANFAMMLADNRGTLEGMKRAAETLASRSHVPQQAAASTPIRWHDEDSNLPDEAWAGTVLHEIALIVAEVDIREWENAIRMAAASREGRTQGADPIGTAETLRAAADMLLVRANEIIDARATPSHTQQDAATQQDAR